MLKYSEQLDYIKCIDMFGYSIKWNIEGNKRTHKTFMGAFSTIGYVFILCVIFYFLCQHSFIAMIG